MLSFIWLKIYSSYKIYFTTVCTKVFACLLKILQKMSLNHSPPHSQHYVISGNLKTDLLNLIKINYLDCHCVIVFGQRKYAYIAGFDHVARILWVQKRLFVDNHETQLGFANIRQFSDKKLIWKTFF